MPRGNTALPVAGRERPDDKALDAFFSLFEPSFRLPPASTLLGCARLFRSESRAQSSCAFWGTLPQPCPRSKIVLPRTPRRDVATTRTQHLIAYSECGRRFLYADPSPGHKMHNQEDDADNQQYVE